MKKLFLASAIALFGLSNAQIAKGTTYVSGVVGYTNDKNNNDDVTDSSFKIVPTVGHFVATNLAVGVGVGYERTSNKQEFTDPTSTTERINSGIVVEPFVRKYWTLSDKLYFFGQLSVPMHFGKSELNQTGVDSDDVKTNSYGVAVKPGLDYFLNKNWTIEATIGEFGYNTTKVDLEGAKNVDNFNFGFNLAAVNLGVKYVFGK